jgi:hypothetical protein
MEDQPIAGAHLGTEGSGSPTHSDEAPFSVSVVRNVAQTELHGTASSPEALARTKFRFVPTRECFKLGAIFIFVTAVLSTSIAMIFLEVGDQNWAYTTIGLILGAVIRDVRDQGELFMQSSGNSKKRPSGGVSKI